MLGGCLETKVGVVPARADHRRRRRFTDRPTRKAVLEFRELRASQWSYTGEPHSQLMMRTQRYVPARKYASATCRARIQPAHASRTSKLVASVMPSSVAGWRSPWPARASRVRHSLNQKVDLARNARRPQRATSGGDGQVDRLLAGREPIANLGAGTREERREAMLHHRCFGRADGAMAPSRTRPRTQSLVMR